MGDIGDRDTTVDLGLDVAVAKEPFPGIVPADALEREIGEFAMVARGGRERFGLRIGDAARNGLHPPRVADARCCPRYHSWFEYDVHVAVLVGQFTFVIPRAPGRANARIHRPQFRCKIARVSEQLLFDLRPELQLRPPQHASSRSFENGFESTTLEDAPQRHGPGTSDDLAAEYLPQLLGHQHTELLRRDSQLRRQGRGPAFIADIALGVSTLSVVRDAPFGLGPEILCLRIIGLLCIENPLEQLHRFIARSTELRHCTRGGGGIVVPAGRGFDLGVLRQWFCWWGWFSGAGFGFVPELVVVSLLMVVEVEEVLVQVP
ncbi:hypothetical protein ACW9HE_13040 [Nocardia gipuzkoensis]|uniref:hypothetical protein n=1 Tax=Nocardia abscessus TaxID=120957 RepID=UPI002456CE22|nr:hypothetical protein [Nocardia abscessus]